MVESVLTGLELDFFLIQNVLPFTYNVSSTPLAEPPYLQHGGRRLELKGWSTLEVYAPEKA